MKNPITLLPRLYKLTFSAFLPVACRYTPTCSEYAEEALAKHGALKGGWLAFKRICRCHPFGGESYDPVPPCNCRKSL